MKLLPIHLGVQRNLLSDRDEDSDQLKLKIFERDDYCCKFCGFQSKKYQQVAYINNNPKDKKSDNMATSCIFCYQCFNIDKVSGMRSAVLIWMPEIEQYKLSHIARAIYVARISQGPIAETARKTLDSIIARRDEVRKRIFTDDPYVISMVLKDLMTDKHYARRESKLDGVRLFPLDRRMIHEADLEFNQFPQILAYWRSKTGPFGGHLPNKWLNLYKEFKIKNATS